MNLQRTIVLCALTGLAGAALVLSSSWGEDLPERRPDDRPDLALLTSLPLVFGETFSLEGGGSPALGRIEQRYKVEPVPLASRANLHGRGLLLMAHPRAQPAEVLVELDQWVRGGGRLLLLADPRLDWPSERPLGDRLRPPPAFADTGLLIHWGVRLAGPDTPGESRSGNGRFEALTSSPGVLESRSCGVERDGFVARCQVGRGHVTVIADADFINVGPRFPSRNLDLLLDELARLETR